MFLAKYQPDGVPEGRRRNLDYSKTQSFQDLLLCRSRIASETTYSGRTGRCDDFSHEVSARATLVYWLKQMVQEEAVKFDQDCLGELRI